MLCVWFSVVGGLACWLASSAPCAANTVPMHPLNARKTLQATSPVEGPAIGSVNSNVWQIGGNASLISVSLDSLQQTTAVSSSPISFSEAPSHPGAKRRLLQGCSCVACSHTQSIPAQATYTLTFSSTNVIDMNIQTTDVRPAAMLTTVLTRCNKSLKKVVVQGSAFLYQLSYQTGYVVDFGSGYSPTSQYTCTDVPKTRFASCPTATSTLQITCTNLLYSCNFKYDISTYTDYSQCGNAPPPPQTGSSSSSGSSGCQCSCCLGSQCTRSDVGTISGVGLRATLGLAHGVFVSSSSCS